MPYYKLVASGRPDVVVDEIILERDEQTGDVTKSLSLTVPKELSSEDLSSATSVVKKYGYGVVEVDAPEENGSEQQPVGADVVGMSPVIEQTGPAVSEVNQQEQEQNAEEAAQGSENEESTGGGVGGSAGSTPAGAGDVSGGGFTTGNTGTGFQSTTSSP